MKQWGHWRPRPSPRTSAGGPWSIITLGDFLLAKGQLYAAQFCYLVSEAEWGVFSNKCAKLVLLLSSASTGDKTLDQFATTEAIQCTEIYEFVQKLGNKHYQMPYLQVNYFQPLIDLNRMPCISHFSPPNISICYACRKQDTVHVPRTIHVSWPSTCQRVCLLVMGLSKSQSLTGSITLSTWQRSWNIW